MRKIVLFIVLLAGIEATVGQTEPQITQYMLNNSAFNPAAVGTKDMIRVSGIYRMLWIGTPNAGHTTIFQANMPITVLGQQNGIGIKFKDDAAGQFFFRAMYLQYAYKTKLGKGKIGIGADLGALNAGFNGDSIVLPNIGNYHDKSDPFLQMSSASGTTFDLGIGVWYETNRFYAGVSYLNATSPTVIWSDKNKFKMIGNAYFTGAYSFNFADPRFVLTPSVFVMTNFTVAQYDFSGVVRYKDKMWGGLDYRWTGGWGNSLGVILGIDILDGLSLGYAYDIPFSAVNSWGSHEISLKYEFGLYGNPKTKHKSVRIL